MASTIQKISFQEYTRLPLREIVKSDSNSSVAIEVTTPTSKVIIDYTYVSIPFLFGTANSVEHPASKIISKLRKLEEEAIEELLNEWKRNLLN